MAAPVEHDIHRVCDCAGQRDGAIAIKADRASSDQSCPQSGLGATVHHTSAPAGTASKIPAVKMASAFANENILEIHSPRWGHSDGRNIMPTINQP